jgi:hypothetical protein
MFNISYIFWCIKTLFEKKKPVFGPDIIRHRTWLEREIQEQLIERDNNFILMPSDNWYDKYL